MVGTSEVILRPEPGYIEWVRPDGVAQLVEFSLTLAPPYRQLDLKYENPFCRLAARTAAGASACAQGCGMDCASQPASHTCPFGQMMVQAPLAGGSAAARWIGRRFPDVESLHGALDRLLAEGLDEETILAHLPPNPIVSPEELREAAGPRRNTASIVHQVTPAPSATPAPAPAARPDDEARLCNLLEYLEQVHRLIGGATRPEMVCERFLRAVSAVVPFDEMAIYLRNREGNDFDLAALVENSGQRDVLHPAACHLEPFGPGLAAITQHRILIQQQGAIQPFNGALEGPSTLALPFPLAGGELLGVWLAHLGDSPRPCALGGEVVRYMRLLSEFLAARLRQLSELSEARVQPIELALPIPVQEASAAALTLADAICREAARGARQNQPFTLLCLQVLGRAAVLDLPDEELSQGLASVLRPYDTFVADPQSPATWFVVLPHTQEEAARMVAARLLTVFEDVLDAHGGAEEQGLRLGLGGSVWGADTISPEQLILHATSAAARAGAGEHSEIQFAIGAEAGLQAEARL